MRILVRVIVAILFGLGTGFVVMEAIELINWYLFPIPANFDFQNSVLMNDYIQTLPTGAFLVVLLAWMAGTFFGAYVATWLAPKMRILHALAIGIVFQMAGLVMVCLYQHPPWFTIIAVASFLPVASLAGLIAERRTVPFHWI